MTTLAGAHSSSSNRSWRLSPVTDRIALPGSEPGPRLRWCSAVLRATRRGCRPLRGSGSRGPRSSSPARERGRRSTCRRSPAQRRGGGRWRGSGRACPNRRSPAWESKPLPCPEVLARIGGAVRRVRWPLDRSPRGSLASGPVATVRCYSPVARGGGAEPRRVIRCCLAWPCWPFEIAAAIV